MKKFIIIFMTFILSLSTIACSGKGTKNKVDNNTPTNSSQDTVENGSSYLNCDIAYGKLESIVGNNIKLSLAKSPEISSEADDNLENEYIIDSANMEVAITGDTGVSDNVDIPKLELEYTGEQKELIIPAGATILSQTGNVVKLNSLKKGSVIMVAMDKETGTVNKIEILE